LQVPLPPFQYQALCSAAEHATEYRSFNHQM
jgi:hypothetical protein